MVGAERFELSTSCTPSKRASQATLRPEPLNLLDYIAFFKFEICVFYTHILYYRHEGQFIRKY
jgi:hypothetical protein